MGVVSECVVRRYIIDILIIIITFPYSTCISSLFGSIIPISLFILYVFSFLLIKTPDVFSPTTRAAKIRARRQTLITRMACDGLAPRGHTFFNVWRRARILAARVVGENTSGVLRTLFVCSAGRLFHIMLALL